MTAGLPGELGTDSICNTEEGLPDWAESDGSLVGLPLTPGLGVRLLPVGRRRLSI